MAFAGCWHGNGTRVLNRLDHWREFDTLSWIEVFRGFDLQQHFAKAGTGPVVYKKYKHGHGGGNTVGFARSIFEGNFLFGGFFLLAHQSAFDSSTLLHANAFSFFSLYRIRLSGTWPSVYRSDPLPLAAWRVALRRVRRGVMECRIVRQLLVPNVPFPLLRFYRT